MSNDANARSRSDFDREQHLIDYLVLRAGRDPHEFVATPSPVETATDTLPQPE